MTLMIFIYIYYGLFACMNLVDVMPLFLTVFHSFFVPFIDFWQKSSGFWQNSPGNHHVDFWENRQFIREIG
jgi:hypothetical protein